MEIPITLEGILSVAGLAVIVGLLMQWVKQWVCEERVYNLIALAVGLALAEVATWIVRGLSPRTATEAVLIGIGAAALATWGYETVANVLGKLGTGARSDDAKAEAAIALITKLNAE